MSYKNDRREEKRKQWDAEQFIADQERHRRASLTMFARIEEFVQDEELRNILHAITERLGMED